jgi:hypothetical protein
MTAKRYRVHGTFIDDYSHTQTTVEMVMASDYDALEAELNGPTGPTQMQIDRTEIARLRAEKEVAVALLREWGTSYDDPRYKHLGDYGARIREFLERLDSSSNSGSKPKGDA